MRIQFRFLLSLTFLFALFFIPFLPKTNAVFCINDNGCADTDVCKAFKCVKATAADHAKSGGLCYGDFVCVSNKQCAPKVVWKHNTCKVILTQCDVPNSGHCAKYCGAACQSASDCKSGQLCNSSSCQCYKPSPVGTSHMRML